MSYIIERFNKKVHRRQHFECEEPALTEYLKHQLSQDERRGIARAYVMVDEADPQRYIKGFYTVSSLSVSLSSVAFQRYQAQTQVKQCSHISPRQEVPAVLIGRLARHIELKGMGAGERLLTDALLLILDISQKMAVHFVVVDAKNERVKQFYQRFGFMTFEDTQDRMFLPVATLVKAFQRRVK